MADYNTLKDAIADVVKQNGNNEITGALLQQALFSMISSLGVGYQFMGVATTSTNPGTPDQRVFYITSTPGEYVNFGGVEVKNAIAILYYNNSGWGLMETSIPDGKETTTAIGRLYVANENMLGFPSQGYVNSIGKIVTDNAASYNLFPVIPVVPGITLTFIGLVPDAFANAISFYSKDGKYISGLNSTQLTDSYTHGTIVVPDGAEYALVSSKDGIDTKVTCNTKYYKNIVLEISRQFTNTQQQLDRLILTTIGGEFTPTIISGYYIANYGAVVANELFGYTEPIELLPGTTLAIYARGYNQNVSMISRYNGAGLNYTPLVVSIDSQLGVYSYKNTTDAALLVACSFDLTPGISIFRSVQSAFIDSGYYGEITDYPYKKGTRNLMYDGRSIHLSEGVTSLFVDSSDTVEKKLNELTITRNTLQYEWLYFHSYTIGNIGKGKYVAFIKLKRVGTTPVSLVVFHGSGNLYALKNLEIQDENYNVYLVEFERPDGATDIVSVGVAAQTTTGASIGDKIYISLCGITDKRTPHSVGSDVYTLEDRAELIGMPSEPVLINARSALFMGIPTMGIIGDSLASGVTWNGTELITNYNFAWWRVLERDSGQTYRYFCAGGLTTRSWFTNSVGWPKASLVENKCAAYIIGLQVNDAYSLGLGYLGAETDINTSDPDLNGDTYFGNYAKIIQKITAINPNAKFFLLTNPRVADTAEIAPFNEAVRTIATKFSNAYLVDIQAEYFNVFTNGVIPESMGPQAHYPAYAYAYMGKLIEEAIGRVIEANANAFKYVQFNV